MREGLTRDEAVTLTLCSSPVLSASHWNLESKRGRIRQASVWPNPDLELEAEDVGVQKDWAFRDADITIGVTQGIPLGGRVALHREYERAGREVAAGEHQVAVLKVSAEVQAAFIHAVAARKRLEMWRLALEVGREARDAIGVRVEAGNLPPADIFRAEADLKQAEIAVADGVAAEEIARRRLAAFWGGAPDEVRSVAGDLLVDDRGPASSRVDLVHLESPHLEVSRRQTDRAKRRARLEEARGIPDLRAGLGFKGTAGFDESALVVSLAIPLPFNDRNQGAVDEARALVRREEALARAERAVWRRALAAAQARLVNCRRQHGALTRTLLPVARKSHQAVETGFREGKLSTIDLLESRRRLVDVGLLEIDAAERFNLARVRLAYMTGNLQELTGGRVHEEE